MKRLAIIDPVGIKAGLDHYDSALCRSLREKSCEAIVFSNFKSSDTYCIQHFPFSFSKSPLQAIKMSRRFSCALKEARAKRVDVILLHLFHGSLMERLFIRMTRRMGFEVCLIVHDVESLIGNHHESRFVECLEMANTIIVHNKTTLLALKEKAGHLESKCHIISHGHYLDLPPLPGKKEALRLFELNEGDRYLLFFGMIKQSKGLDILIDAMKHLPPDVHLIVAGRPRDVSYSDYEDMIRERDLAGRVHAFTRYITNEERAAFFSIADLVILPYRKIYQSGVMLLAMSYGRPVIASDLAANKETITDGKNGWLFDSGDVSQLAEKIGFALENNTAAGVVTESAKEYLRRHHDWSAIASELIDILNR